MFIIFFEEKKYFASLKKILFRKIMLIYISTLIV